MVIACRPGLPGKSGGSSKGLLSREVYYRQFVNRRQVGSFLGLTPSPYSSGEEERCQGISRAGSGHVRAIMNRPWFTPSPPLDIDVLARQVVALPHPPDAIEALWDGDSDGWSSS